MDRTRKKRRVKLKYSLLIIPNRADRPTKRKTYNPRVVAFFVVLFWILVGAGALYVSYSAGEVLKRDAAIYQLEQEAVEQSDFAKTQEQTISELNEKIAVLTVTLADMRTAEEERLAKEALKYEPYGLPVGGTASYVESFDQVSGAPILLFTAAQGTDVIATAYGIVSYVGSDDEYLNIIQVDHGNGYVTVYRNHSLPTVTVGTEVIRGTELYEIAGEAETLGYQILFNGSYVDPMDLMQVFG